MATLILLFFDVNLSYISGVGNHTFHHKYLLCCKGYSQSQSIWLCHYNRVWERKKYGSCIYNRYRGENSIPNINCPSISENHILFHIWKLLEYMCSQTLKDCLDLSDCKKWFSNVLGTMYNQYMNYLQMKTVDYWRRVCNYRKMNFLHICIFVNCNNQSRDYTAVEQ